MPTADALTEEQFETAGYGQFNGTPTRRDLERFFFFDDADRRLVAKRRGDHNRLGFALQAVTDTYVGTLLAAPLDVPTKVAGSVAKPPDPAHGRWGRAYPARGETRAEPPWAIW